MKTIICSLWKTFNIDAAAKTPQIGNLGFMHTSSAGQHIRSSQSAEVRGGHQFTMRLNEKYDHIATAHGYH